MECKLNCVLCGREFDSMDSYADTKQSIYFHLLSDHGWTEEIYDIWRRAGAVMYSD